MKPGEYYGEKRIRKGLEKAREVYGSRRLLRVHRASRTTSSATTRTRTSRRRPTPLKAPEPDHNGGTEPTGPPVVDVTMRMQEGQQFFVNRITFVGNTTTRDNVIRREMRLVENGVVQHRGAEVQRQAAQSARLLQGARGQAGRGRRPEDAERDQQGRRQAEARRAEPQPADLRRRRVGVRRLLRSAVVPDRELPGTRREPDALAAGRVARAELLARLHRAVPVRSQHHRRLQPLQGRRPLHRPVHAEVGRAPSSRWASR